MTKTFADLDPIKKTDVLVRYGSMYAKSVSAHHGGKRNRLAEAVTRRLGYYICGIARAPHSDVYRERLWHLTHDLGGRYPIDG